MYLVNWLIKHQCTFRISICDLFDPGAPVIQLLERLRRMWEMPNKVNWDIDVRFPVRTDLA